MPRYAQVDLLSWMGLLPTKDMERRMLSPARTTSFTNMRFWNRMRVQVGGGLLFAVALPMAALALSYPNFSDTVVAQMTGVGASVAVVLSVVMLRNISLYPGISSSSFVLPAVLAAYGKPTFLIFLFFRLDYSRAVALSAGGAMLVWLYFVHLMIDRGPALRIGIVPVGSTAALSELPSLEVTWLSEPRLNETYDLLVADFRANLSDEWEAFLANCALAGVPVLHVKQLVELLTGRVEIEHLSENSFGSLIPFVGYLRLRRAIDFVSAVIVGVLAIPVFVVVAVLIKMDLPGPILFRQVRVGYRGELFVVAKFRTMVANRDEDALDGVMTKDNDERITPISKTTKNEGTRSEPSTANESTTTAVNANHNFLMHLSYSSRRKTAS